SRVLRGRRRDLHEPPVCKIRVRKEGTGADILRAKRRRTAHAPHQHVENTGAGQGYLIAASGGESREQPLLGLQRIAQTPRSRRRSRGRFTVEQLLVGAEL